MADLPVSNQPSSRRHADDGRGQSRSSRPLVPRRVQEPEPQMTVGRYTRLDEIGRGSFAVVYQGVHNKHRSWVAIKSVTLSKLNRKLKENLKLEIDILKNLHHPHVVALLDCQETSKEIHLVMEYCALGDLSIFIKKRHTLCDHPLTKDVIAKYPNPTGGGLNEVLIRHFLKQLASALQFLRERDLVHRDIKPQNLLLNPSPIAFAKGLYKGVPYKRSEDSLTPMVGLDSLPMLKIADFGFARSLPSTSLAETLCGSPLYMAPEILKYQKYDAKADLWSVGAVTYEMVVGKPPFRASNHIELVKKIEETRDKIRFPDTCDVSDSLKRLIRGLLKINPVERMNFKDFFESPVIKGPIPGLAPEDQEPIKVNTQEPSPMGQERRPPSGRDNDAVPSPTTPLSSSPREALKPTNSRPSSGNTSRPGTPVRRVGSRDTTDLQRAAVTARRASLADQPPSPRQDVGDRTHVALAMERQRSRNTSSPGSSLLKERPVENEFSGKRQADQKDAEREKERTAQEIAFERDYVVVEKRAVEVNAFADELAASPRIQQQNQASARHAGAIVRRATTSSTPHSSSAPQNVASRAVQIVSGRRRADSGHQRQSSYERRYGPSSATSAISKALNMASGRLFGVEFSPPLALTRDGRSPPMGYNPFPAYPLPNESVVLVGDGGRALAVMDEDSKTIQIIEECATRSDVVYGFAEVKYKQLIPLTPSMQPDPAMQPGMVPAAMEVDPSELTDGLTVDAMVTLSEEALVLYVKALSLLAKSMDIAGGWWARKNRGEVIGESPTSRPDSRTTSATAAVRVNNVVQWVRNRFNEVLEKAEFVRMKLCECQKRLPPDHPFHPSNHSAESYSAAGLGTSVDHVFVSSGITAEKLMYDRALEMSRTAAINELTGEDLQGCDIAYVTAIRMLEAVLDSDEEEPRSKKADQPDGEEQVDEDNLVINGVHVDNRKVVAKLVSSIRTRLSDLRKKIAIMRQISAPPAVPSSRSLPNQPRSSSPTPGPPR